MCKHNVVAEQGLIKRKLLIKNRTFVQISIGPPIFYGDHEGMVRCVTCNKLFQKHQLLK